MSHSHSGAVAHQFEDAEQQRETVNLGMWSFLITEIMMFGALFTAYFYYRQLYPEAWMDGSNHLNYILGAINTAVLICSSLTMALAVHAAQQGKKGKTIIFLLGTMALGTTFLCVKVIEYSDKWTHHLIPGHGFIFEGPFANQVELFYVFYFTMTGLHALHMIVGLGILSWLVYMAYKGKFTKEYNAPVEMTGLYWHFVDIVWIYLFPFLYLIGRS